MIKLLCDSVYLLIWRVGGINYFIWILKCFFLKEFDVKCDWKFFFVFIWSEIFDKLFFLLFYEVYGIVNNKLLGLGRNLVVLKIMICD